MQALMDMKDNTKMIVDIRGYSCPISLAMIAKTFNTINMGQNVEILSDDETIHKDIEQWCLETGNILYDFVIDKSTVRMEIIKGKGYKPSNIIDFIRFILLGIRLHIKKLFISLFKPDAAMYLVTFVSVAEGMRAHQWLEDSNNKITYALLPVPDDITSHCGVVMGVTKETQANGLFAILQKNQFKVENIYIRQNYTYKPLTR